MTFQRALVRAALVLLAASGCAAGQLAAVVRSGDADAREAIVSALASHGLPQRLDSVYDDGRVEVLATDALDADQLFQVARRIETEDGVLAAGELFERTATSVEVFSGWVRAGLSDARDQDAVRDWANESPRLRIAEMDTQRLSVLLEARSERGELEQRLASLPPPAGPAERVMYRFGRVLPPVKFGGYHRIPKGKNKLIVVLEKVPVDWAQFLGSIGASEEVLSQSGGVAATGLEIRVLSFANNPAMIQGLASLDSVAEVTASGPMIHDDPPRFIADELMVDFVSETAFNEARPILAFYGFQLERRRSIGNFIGALWVPLSVIGGQPAALKIPYLDHGYMFRREVQGEPGASYVVYDAARELLEGHLARVAVPNEITINVPLADTECDRALHHIEPVKAAAAWEVANQYPRSSVVGLLDRGFSADGGYNCSELNVVALLDSKTCTGSGCSDPSTCIPGEGETWCDACPYPKPRDTSANDAHSKVVANVLGAWDTSTVDTDRMIGVAPGARMISAAQDGLSSTWQVASALWWMAGGHPNESTIYPTPLEQNQASVLNLSVGREYCVVPTCPEHDESSGEDPIDPRARTICAAVCTDQSTCTVIDEALEKLRLGHEADERLREGGVLVVAAAPNASIDSDLHSSPFTFAVSSVNAVSTAAPDTSYQWNSSDAERSPSIDLVAPMGSSTSTPLCRPDDTLWNSGGQSSLATGVVSAVASLMFDVNPSLTAIQAECILRTTAQRDNVWSSPQTGCEFLHPGPEANPDVSDYCGEADTPVVDDPDQSWCYGYGMVDAEAAVQGAADCRPCTEPYPLVDQTTREPFAWIEEACFLSRNVDTDLENWTRSPWCACNAEGEQPTSYFPVAISNGFMCLNCWNEDEEEGDPGEVEIDPEVVEYLVLERIARFLHCFPDECVCENEEFSCVALEIVNDSSKELFGVSLQLCKDEICVPMDLRMAHWDLDAEALSMIDEWAPSEKLSVWLPLTEEFAKWWGEAGEPHPTVEILAKGEPVELK